MSQPSPLGSLENSTHSQNSDSQEFGVKEHEWIIYALGAARAILRKPINCGIDQETYERFCHIFPRQSPQNVGNRLPSLFTLRRIWTKMQDPDTTVIGKHPGGRPKIECESDIQATLSIGKSKNVRSIAQDIQVSKSTVHRRLSDDLKLTFLRVRRAQMLDDFDILRRFDACSELHHLITHGGLDISNLFMTDEHMTGFSFKNNRQIDGRWLSSDDPARYDLIQPVKSYDSELHMWAGISVTTGIVRPYFIDEMENPDPDPDPKVEKSKAKRMNGVKYRHFIANVLAPELERRLGSSLNKIWFQQDGAACHTSTASLEYLVAIFGKQLISDKTKLSWPPHSPDLTVCDYFLWSELDRRVSKRKPANIGDLKIAYKLAASEINRDTNLIRRVFNDVDLRLLACMEKGGAHFEPWFAEFKTRFRKSTCNLCKKIHRCTCQLCSKNCADTAARLEDEELMSDTSTQAASECGHEDWELYDIN